MVYVLFNLIQIFLLDVIVDIFIAGSFTPFYVHNEYVDLIIALAFPYLIVSAILVWISGKNAKWYWRFLSRIGIFLPIIYATFHLV